MRKLYALLITVCVVLTVSAAAHAEDRPIGPASGDLTLTYPNPQVSGLQGHALPSFGSVGCLQSNGTTWSIGSCGSGSFTAAGDLSGSSTTQTVIGIRGISVPTPTVGYPHYNGTSIVWDVPGSGFAAGGDLTGTATSQTVASLSGPAPINVGNGVLALGTSPATTGALRFPNNTGAFFRNAGNSANLIGIQYDSGNGLNVGDIGNADTIVQSGGGVLLAPGAASSSWQFNANQVVMLNTSTSYALSQLDLATTSGTAHNFTFHCGQNETGTGTTIGGDCVLTTGSGATNGKLHLQIAGSDKLVLGTTGLLQLPAYSTGIAHIDSSGNVSSTTVNLASSTDVGSSIAGVSNGGTGRSSITANSVVVGNGTSAITLESGSSTGQYLRWNASGPPTFQSGPTYTIATYCASGCTGTSGSTITCPAAGFVEIGAVGGGGGGGGGATGSTSTTPVNGGGGGGGAPPFSWSVVPCTSGSSLVIALGAGGSSGPAGIPGGDGGNTTLVDSTHLNAPLMKWAGGGGGGPGIQWVNTWANTTVAYAQGGSSIAQGQVGQVNSTFLPTAGQGGNGGIAAINSVGAYTSTGLILLAFPGSNGSFNEQGNLFVNTNAGGSAGTSSTSIVSGEAGGSGGGGGAGSSLGGNGGNGGAGSPASGTTNGGSGGACTGYGSGGGGGGAGPNNTSCNGSSNCLGGAGSSGCPGAAIALIPSL